MIITRNITILLLLCIGLACASCATVIEGQFERVRYDGGPGELTFYDSSGTQIPSDHEFEPEEKLHFNFIELDKRRSEHIITARHGDLLQRDTLHRRFVYSWLVPDALIIYVSPIFAGIDVLSSSIYSFPAPRVNLTKGDIGFLPAPLSMTLEAEAEKRYRAQKLLLNLHTGLLMPSFESPSTPPAYGIAGSYRVADDIWTGLGYSYAFDYEQVLGYARRSYKVEAHSIEAGVHYDPFKFAYVLGGVGFQHLIFQLGSRPDDPEKRFGRNVMTASFGAGLYFRSLYLELRRNLALARIETPEGPGHYVQSTHLRAGLAIRFEPPW
jgi:hypothetical protein